MGGENDWLHGYLEAILDVGAGRSGVRDREGRGKVEGNKRGSLKNNIRKKLDDDRLNFENMDILRNKDDKLFSPTKYFVEEIVTSFDEAEFRKTWSKVVATGHIQQRNNRLENMCWRIWHLARKKKQIAWDATQKLVQRRHEREVGRRDAAEDLSELSEGEREKGERCSLDSPAEVPRVDSSSQIWSEDKPRELYIVLISLHGLVRGENMELGRDSDTGGQVKYVVELARALANMAPVYRVDLLTRQITSPEVNSIYGEPIEMLSCPSEGVGSCGAYIIRIPCGPTNKYIPKESLWPYIAEFVDGALSHIVHVARAIGDQINGGKPVWPYVIHGHYADAGDVAAHLSGVLNVPMVLTGHSLGRNKLDQLLKQGTLSREDINSTYKIMRRIEAEEHSLDAAVMVVTSTRQEIEEQWGMYDGFDVRLEKKLRIRRRRGDSCHGRYMPRMVVIPPGMDFSNVMKKDSSDMDTDLKSFIGSDKTRKMPPIWSEVMRFLANPHKPMILALSRPDPKKNVTTLLKAFGESQLLQQLANLTLILGNRDNIEDMPESSSSLLTTVLKLIDKYNLYGMVAFPKHHKQPDVPQIYRLAAKTKGVFINPALVEPFGLTLIEAAAYGLPIVATKNGGPVDILKVLNNGLLVDPHDQKSITGALLKLLSNKSLWNECRKNGLKNIHKFSWPEHCRTYLSHVEQCRSYNPTSHHSVLPVPEEPLSESLSGIEDLSLNFSTDLDINVTGELDAASRQQKVIEILQQKMSSTTKPLTVYSPGRRKWLYAVATDCYSSEGSPTENFPLIIKNVMEAAGSNSSHIGFMLLTSLSLQETKDVLQSSQLNVKDFDALICCSGSEIYYPWRDMELDEDYESHIQFRWPGENVKSMVMRQAKIEKGAENDNMELQYCSQRCYSYNLKLGTKTRKIDDLRLRLRMRGLRCNLVYANAATRLNAVPLFASRSQALRYLSAKWGVDLSKVVLFIGESGDTDYRDLLGGLHKNVVLRNSVCHSSEMMDNAEESYMEIETAAKSSSRTTFAEGFELHDLVKVLGCSLI